MSLKNLEAAAGPESRIKNLESRIENLECLLHLLELLDGQVDREVEHIQGKPVKQLECIVESWKLHGNIW